MSDILAIAADHGGFDLKSALVPIAQELGVTVLDLGTRGRESVDYPEFADAVAACSRGGRGAAFSSAVPALASRLRRTVIPVFEPRCVTTA